MMPVLTVTDCPVLILTEFKLMSAPVVPTVRPLMIAMPPPSLMRAIAATPLPMAVPDFGTPSMVNAQLGGEPPTEKLGLLSAMTHSTAA